MKKIYLLVLFVICFQLAKAINEIPNPGFESWASGSPVGWYTSNIPGVAMPVTQSLTYHTGLYAVKGQGTIAVDDTIPAVLMPGDPFAGIPISANYAQFEFYYQCTLNGNDVLNVTILIYDASNYIIGSASEDIGVNGYLWTKKVITIDYSDNTPATKAIIQISLQPVAGSTRYYPLPSSSFILDDVALSGQVGLEAIHADYRLQVFPVPAHDRIFINAFTDQSTPFHFVLTDVSGRVVMERRNTNAPFNDFISEEIYLQGIAPGVYSLAMLSDKNLLVRKIIIE